MPKRLPGVPPAAVDAAPGGAAAVDRALLLLGSFRAGDGSLSLAQLAQRTGLHKSTALRLIASLAHRSFLGRLPDGRYALSSEIARLHGVYAASFSLERVVLPVLAQLVQQTGESAAFHVMQMQREQPVRLCLFRVDSPHPVRDHIKAGGQFGIEGMQDARARATVTGQDVARLDMVCLLYTSDAADE